MWISEEVNCRLREFIITQMLNWLRFLLAVNDITDSNTITFDEFCADKRNGFIKWYNPSKNILNFKCLWDIIFVLINNDLRISYTQILSAYCRSNKIATKKDLYVKMSSELDHWVDTIGQFDEIVILSIVMSQNSDIWEELYKYDMFNMFDINHDIYNTFYTNTLDILIKNNFENIDPYSDDIQPYKPIRTKYDDPHQQVFYKYIMLRFHTQHLYVGMTSNNICELLSRIILNIFNINIIIMYEKIMFNNIDQIIDYFESKIPQYPAEIKYYLSILASIKGFIPMPDKIILANLAKMAELSNYNLRNLPIDPIIYGFSGATPLGKIPLEQIPEYYARLTHNYSGQHTKAARR